MIVFCITLIVLCSYLKIRNASLESEIDVINTENTILKEEISTVNKVLKDTVSANIELSNTVNTYRLSNQKLTSKLQKLDKNIDKIAERHPDLLNKIINKSQSKLNKCLEEISKFEKDENNEYKDCID